MKKLAVLFPGMGYTCQKPLLYYSNKLCQELGYETILLDYGPEIPKKPEEAVPYVCEKMIPTVLALPFEAYDEIVFIGKSLGTILSGEVCSRIPAERLKKPVRCVFLTPVVQTTKYFNANAIVLSGTADPWIPEHETLVRDCAEHGVACHSFPGANHSLEVTSTEENLSNLARAMGIVREFLVS